MSDLISKAALFNALANAQDKAEIFAVINAAPTVDVVEAAKLLKRHCDMNSVASTSKKCNCKFCHGYEGLYYCELSQDIPADWYLEGEQKNEN